MGGMNTKGGGLVGWSPMVVDFLNVVERGSGSGVVISYDYIELPTAT